MTEYSPSYIGNFYTRVSDDGTFVESNEQPWFQGGHGYPVLRHPDGDGWIFPNLAPYDPLYLRAYDGWVSVALYGNRISGEQNISNLSRAGGIASGVMAARTAINSTVVVDGVEYPAGATYPAKILEYRDSCSAGYHKDNIFEAFTIVKSGDEVAYAGGCPIDTKLIGGQATVSNFYIANDGDPTSIQVTLTLQNSNFAGQNDDPYVYFPEEVAEDLRQTGSFVFYVTSPGLFETTAGYVSDYTIDPETPPTYSSYLAKRARDATDVVGNSTEIFSCESNIPVGTQIVLDIPFDVYNIHSENGVFCIAFVYKRVTYMNEYIELDSTFVEQNAVFITEPPATLDYIQYLIIDVYFSVTANGTFKAIP